MPFGLFKKKEKEMEMLEKKEMEDLSSLGLEKGIAHEIPTFEDEFKIQKMPEVPKLIEERKELAFDELPLKGICEKIDDELKRIKREMKKIKEARNLMLESPEFINLLELYTTLKEKFQEFIDEINKLELDRVKEKTSAAIYKFKACKALAEIKKQTEKIESLCEKTGLVPSKIQDIIKRRAEDLVNSFLLEEEKT